MIHSFYKRIQIDKMMNENCHTCNCGRRVTFREAILRFLRVDDSRWFIYQMTCPYCGVIWEFATSNYIDISILPEKVILT